MSSSDPLGGKGMNDPGAAGNDPRGGAYDPRGGNEPRGGAYDPRGGNDPRYSGGDPRTAGLEPELANNRGQDSMARVMAALSGIGLLLSAVMPWASLGIGNGLVPSDMGVNQLFAGFTREKGWLSMAVPLVIAGLCMLLGALLPSRKPGRKMFGRISSGGSPSGRRGLLTLGTLLALVTTVLWAIQIGQFRINDGFDFLPGNVQYGAWIAIAATIAGLLATALSYFGAARSVKVPKTSQINPPGTPGARI